MSPRSDGTKQGHFSRPVLELIRGRLGTGHNGGRIG